MRLPSTPHRYLARPLTITNASPEAYEQLSHLRTDFLKGLGDTDDDSLADTIVALIIWGHITSVARLLAILEGLASATWSGTADVLVVPCRHFQDAWSLAGLAACAGLGLMRMHPPVPSEDQIDRLVHRALPSRFRPGRYKHCTRNLCDLVQLARKIEAPGLMASMEDGSLGGRHLDMPALLAWLGDLDRSREASTGCAETSELRVRVRAQPSTPLAERAAYRHLLAAVHDPRSFHALAELTGPKPRGNGHPARISVLQEWLLQDPPPMLTAWMATWVICLANPGANRRSGKSLSTRTIQTYLSLVQRPLFAGLRDMDESDLDEDLLREALSGALSRCPDLASRQATALNRMFADLRRDIDIPPLNLPAYAHDRTHDVDADIITEVESDRFFSTLAAIAHDDKLALETRLAFAQLSHAMRCMARTGMRRGELAYLRQHDIWQGPHHDFLHVRPHQTRKLKSPAARRLLTVDRIQPCPQTAGDQLVWPALTDRDLGFTALDAATAALRAATGQSTIRLHHWRHTLATRRFEGAYLHESMEERVVALHRLSADLGHASLATSAASYIHTAQYISAHRYRSPSGPCTQRAIARLLGLSHAAWRQRLSRSGIAKGDAIDTVLASIWPDLASPSSEGIDCEMHGADSPRMPAWLTADKPDVAAIIQLVYRLALDPGCSLATCAGSMARSTTLDCLLTIYRLSERIRWWPVSAPAVEHQIAMLDQAFSIELGAKPGYSATRRSISRSIITAWQERIPADAAALIGDSRCISELAGFGWRSSNPFCHCDTPEGAQRLSDLFAALHAPIRCIRPTREASSSSVVLQLELTGPAHARMRAATIRFIIFCILLTGRIEEKFAINRRF